MYVNAFPVSYLLPFPSANSFHLFLIQYAAAKIPKSVFFC